MKKLFLSTIALTLFSFAIVIFQLSCKKEVNAQTSNGTPQQNKILFTKTFTSSANVYYGEIWMANFDGSNQVKVNISFPTGYGISESPDARLSPDGTKIFFNAGPTNVWKDIYSCNLDGSNATKIVTGGRLNEVF